MLPPELVIAVELGSDEPVALSLSDKLRRRLQHEPALVANIAMQIVAELVDAVGTDNASKDAVHSAATIELRRLLAEMNNRED